MLNPKVHQIFTSAHNYAESNNHEFVTSEHILLYLIEDSVVKQVLQN